MRARLLAVGLLWGMVCAGPVATAAVREWTSARGAKIEAEFVSLKAGIVTLKNVEGTLVEIQLTQLSASDQALARQLGQPQLPRLPGRSPEPAEDAHAPALPALTTDDWPGCHAVVEQPLMTVTIHTNGTFAIHPKHDGQPVGKPAGCGMHIWYYRNTRDPREFRAIESFTGFAAPSRNAAAVRFGGTASGNTSFAAEFTFANNAVEVRYDYHEPRSAKAPQSALRLQFLLGPTHRFADDTPRDQIIQTLTGYFLRFDPVKGNAVEHNYYEHHSLATPVVSATIKGPWGPRELTFSRTKNDPLYLQNYTLTPLHRGYYLIRDAAPDTKTAPLRITIK